ncbi:MAG: efflux RND transporter periplasmic adaptor subunit [Gammaproteobacteria bacterium]|nr:efflux RND transporter periplasmic adaptor subunit [Gammaproteobacteria bacterium]MCW8924154.1 efflux RND transporter periplasmic adaptor subunit [Gammaproteobacteria bacterium]
MMKTIILLAAVLMLAFNAHADEVKVGALVTGQVTQVRVTAGQQVKAGELVLKIDDRYYQARLKALTAEIAYRKAALADTRIEFEQTQDMYDRTVIARRPLERAQRDLDMAQQALIKAEGELEMHKAWLDYYHVKAPVNGQIKSLAVTQGSTVFKENDALFTIETP